MAEKIALTQTVQKGGCAAKVAAAELRQMLAKVTFPPPHPQLLIDGGLFDDAAIYRVSENLALVQTLDFFTPILDTPRKFGEVAAANALSDVYAMGGTPKTAMGILAFPLATMDSEVIVEVMQGASDKILEAEACFVGGHSIDDDTLKFGLSVTGFVDPAKIWSNAGAKPGDHLILTKPLGTGTLTAGLKRREFSEEQIGDAIESMTRLNRILDLLSDDLKDAIHAATDITGFGLSGHSMQLAQASQVSLRIQSSRLPRFELTMESLRRGMLTKAHRSNSAYTADQIQVEGLTSDEQLLLHDPQTSGGLLLAVSSNLSVAIVERLRTRFEHAAVIGEVVSAQAKRVSYELGPSPGKA